MLEKRTNWPRACAGMRPMSDSVQRALAFLGTDASRDRARPRPSASRIPRPASGRSTRRANRLGRGVGFAVQTDGVRTSTSPAATPRNALAPGSPEVRASMSRCLCEMTPQVANEARLQDAETLSDHASLGQGPAPATARSLTVPTIDLGSIDIDGRGSASLLWREALHRRLLLVADATSATLALTMVLTVVAQHRVSLAVAVGVPVVLLLFKAAGLYDRDDLRLVHSTLDEVPALAQLTGLFALGVACVQTVVLGGTLLADQIAVLWVASFAAILSGRVLARAVAGRTSPPERCLVIGEAAQADRIRDKLAASQARACVIASLPLAGEHLDASGMGNPGVIRHLVHELNVDRIIIAPTTTDTSDVVDLIRIAKAVGVRVSVLPRMFEVVGTAVEIDNIDGMTMLGVRRFGLSRSSRFLKRAFDVVIASVGSVIVGPLIAVIALAIRLDSKGSIFFRQVRVGRDGKHFRIFKFRSMVTDAEAQKENLRSLNEAGDGLFKLTDDPRVTRVGRFLRRYFLGRASAGVQRPAWRNEPGGAPAARDR